MPLHLRYVTILVVVFCAAAITVWLVTAPPDFEITASGAALVLGAKALCVGLCALIGFSLRK